MFTDEDYREYFEEILSKEKEMFYSARRFIDSIDDEDIIRKLKSIMVDESNHFSYIKELLDLLPPEKAVSRRQDARRHLLGRLVIKELCANSKTEAIYLDISEGGLCVESPMALALNNSYELWIDMPEAEEPTHRTGKLVWVFEIRSNLYVGGIKFTNPQG